MVWPRSIVEASSGRDAVTGYRACLTRPRHDVEAIKGHPDLEGLPDSDIVAVARREHRAIVTSNVRDFSPFYVELVTPGGADHAGFVFVLTTYRLAKSDVGRLVTALEIKLAAYPADLDLANAETWIAEPGNWSNLSVGVSTRTHPTFASSLRENTPVSPRRIDGVIEGCSAVGSKRGTRLAAQRAQR
jgi:hypothetical protein